MARQDRAAPTVARAATLRRHHPQDHRQVGARAAALGSALGTAAAKAPLAMPRNATTSRQYSGINVLILWGAVIQHGFPTQNWLTFRQALSLGGNVRKGERGTTVVYADRFTPEDEKRRARETGEEPGRIPFLKRFTVFNAAQCEGLPEEIATDAPPPPPGLIEPKVEALIKATGIDFRIGGDRAFICRLWTMFRCRLRKPISSQSTGTARPCTRWGMRLAMPRDLGGISRAASALRNTPLRSLSPK